MRGNQAGRNNSYRKVMNVILFEQLTFSLMLKGLVYCRRGDSVFYQSYKKGGVLINLMMRTASIRNWIEQRIKFHDVNRGIAERGDLFYRIQPWVVNTTNSFFEQNNVRNDSVLKLFRRHFRTGNKADIFTKRLIQIEMYEFIKWFAPFNEDGCAEKTLYYHSNILNEFILREWANTFGLKVHLSKMHIFTSASAYSFMAYFMKLFSRLHTFRLMVRSKPKKAEVLFNPQFSISEGLLSNDFFVGEKLVSSQDVLFYFYGKESDDNKPGSFEIIKRKGYKYVFIDDLQVPLTKVPWFIKEKILMPVFFLIVEILCLGKGYFSFVQIKHFYSMVDSSGVEKLLCHYKFNKFLFQSTAGLLYQVMPVYGQRYKIKTVLCPIGTTVFRAILCDYAFQNADVGLAWGRGIYHLYENTSDFSNIALVGFTGKEYFQDLLQNKDKLYSSFPKINRNMKTITFYDVPYYPHHGGISAETFRKYYESLLECAQWKDVNVILRTKNLLDPGKFPNQMRAIFEDICRRIKESDVFVLDRSAIDPLDCIAVSDINVSIELSSPATLALLCRKIGLFYNVVNNGVIKHGLFPKYCGSLIFDDTKMMLTKIRQYLDEGTVAGDIVDEKDLDVYDAPQKRGVVNRFCQELLSQN